MRNAGASSSPTTRWLMWTVAGSIVGGLFWGCWLDTSGLKPGPATGGTSATGGATSSGSPGGGGTGPIGGRGGTGGSGAVGAGGSGGSGGVPAGGSGGTGPVGGSGGSGGEGGTCDFSSQNDCQSAQGLASISGDVGTDTASASGVGSQWLDIHVTENHGNVVSLSYSASLTSPGGMDYDLYVYTGDNSSTNCSAPPVRGTGSPETVSASWSDVGGAGADGRWLSLEVRYVSGPYCDASSQWSLTVTGNTQ